jgi:hypothetical protein
MGAFQMRLTRPHLRGPVFKGLLKVNAYRSPRRAFCFLYIIGYRVSNEDPPTYRQLPNTLMPIASSLNSDIRTEPTECIPEISILYLGTGIKFTGVDILDTGSVISSPPVGEGGFKWSRSNTRFARRPLLIQSPSPVPPDRVPTDYVT